MVVSVDGVLPKDECFVLIDEKLYQHPGLFNTNHDIQTYQVDLSQMCNINVLVEEQEEKIDKFEKTARNTQYILGLIGFFNFFWDKDFFQSFLVLFVCIILLYALEKRPKNYQKAKKAVLELSFNDQTKISLEVNRDESESLHSILEKNKNNANQIVKDAIYLGSLTAAQKDTARARYWQIPAATLLFFALNIKVMLIFMGFKHKTSEIDAIPIVSALEKMSNTDLFILSYVPTPAFVLIICTWIIGEWRRKKLNKYDDQLSSCSI